jgi:hypothetical protein
MSKPTAGFEYPNVSCISGNAGDMLETPRTATRVIAKAI